LYLISTVPAHFKEKSINKSGVVGSRVVLTCEAEGSKPLNIEWNPSVDNINTRNTNKGIISELYLNSLHSSQTGIYTCMATNSYGYDHMTINLVVRGRLKEIFFFTIFLWIKSMLLFRTPRISKAVRCGRRWY